MLNVAKECLEGKNRVRRSFSQIVERLSATITPPFQLDN